MKQNILQREWSCMTSSPTVLSTCYWFNYSCYANCISHLVPSCLRIFDTGLACKQSCSFSWEKGIVSGKVFNVPLLSECWQSRAELGSSVGMNSSCCNLTWRNGRVCGVLFDKNKSFKIFFSFLCFLYRSPCGTCLLVSCLEQTGRSVLVFILNIILHFRYTKPLTFADCISDELPLGWEEAYDPQVGVYYIDHNTSKWCVTVFLQGDCFVPVLKYAEHKPQHH